MRTIDRENLKQRLDRGDDLKLRYQGGLSDWAAAGYPLVGTEPGGFGPEGGAAQPPRRRP